MSQRAVLEMVRNEVASMCLQLVELGKFASSTGHIHSDVDVECTMAKLTDRKSVV